MCKMMLGFGDRIDVCIGKKSSKYDSNLYMLEYDFGE